MAQARFQQAVNYRQEKSAGSTGWLHDNLGRKITVGRVPNQVQDQFDHPSAREYFAVVGSGIGRLFPGSIPLRQKFQLLGPEHHCLLIRTGVRF